MLASLLVSNKCEGQAQGWKQQVLALQRKLRYPSKGLSKAVGSKGSALRLMEVASEVGSVARVLKQVVPLEGSSQEQAIAAQALRKEMATQALKPA